MATQHSSFERFEKYFPENMEKFDKIWDPFKDKEISEFTSAKEEYLNQPSYDKTNKFGTMELSSGHQFKKKKNEYSLVWC